MSGPQYRYRVMLNERIIYTDMTLECVNNFLFTFWNGDPFLYQGLCPCADFHWSGDGRGTEIKVNRYQIPSDPPPEPLKVRYAYAAMPIPVGR